MTKEKVGFTPGPWNAQFPGYITIPSSSALIATVWNAANGPTAGQQESNMRLIAAAPDLYEALKEMLAGLECEFGRYRTEVNFKSAYAALAKAEGNAT